MAKSPSSQGSVVQNQPDGWAPVLNPTQQLIFDCPSRYILAHGEKGSGKTVGCLHALVRHCYLNKNALAIIIALSIRTGKEGALYDLENLVLPAWRDGNRHPEWVSGVKHPQAGELMDGGMGLEYTEAKQDPDTKDRVIKIKNIFGTTSKILLVSIPYSEAVEARTKGPAPSFVYLEEATNMASEEYFTFPAAQQGRRRDIKDPMQLYASCNPTGPSHWVYQTWWVNCINQETGLRDPDYAVFHVPVTENIDRLPPGYVERLAQLFKDPIQRRRLINGEWIDRPSGDAIFKNFFYPDLHVKGDALKDRVLIPRAGFPVVVSYDPGPVNFCVSMLQRVPIAGKSKWLVFDELNFVGEYTPYHRVVPLILKRMDFWNEKAGTEFTYTHIADDSSFNQIKSDGSYDAMVIERLGGGRIKLRGCPRAKDSVSERIQMLIGYLLEEEIYFSVRCKKIIDSIRLLSSKHAKPGEYDAKAGLKPVRSPYLHPFDSLTYGLMYFQLFPNKFNSLQIEHVTPMAYTAGGG